MDGVRREVAALGQDVTDQTVLQHLRRFYGFDLRPVAERMVTRRVQEAILAGARKIHVGDWTMCVLNFTVTTVRERRPSGHRRKPSNRDRSDLMDRARRRDDRIALTEEACCA